MQSHRLPKKSENKSFADIFASGLITKIIEMSDSHINEVFPETDGSQENLKLSGIPFTGKDHPFTGKDHHFQFTV